MFDLRTNDRSRDLFLGRNRRGVRAPVVSLRRDKIDSQKLPRPDRFLQRSRRYRELRRASRGRISRPGTPVSPLSFPLSLFSLSFSLLSLFHRFSSFHFCLSLLTFTSSGISVADRFNPWVVSATGTRCNLTLWTWLPGVSRIPVADSRIDVSSLMHPARYRKQPLCIASVDSRRGVFYDVVACPASRGSGVSRKNGGIACESGYHMRCVIHEFVPDKRY